MLNKIYSTKIRPPQYFINTSGSTLLSGRVVRMNLSGMTYASTDTWQNSVVLGILAKETLDTLVGPVYLDSFVGSEVFNLNSFVENQLPTSPSWIYLADNGQLTTTPPQELSEDSQIIIGVWVPGRGLNITITPWGIA